MHAVIIVDVYGRDASEVQLRDIKGQVASISGKSATNLFSDY